MVKLRDLILDAMTDEEKAEVKPRAAEAMSDDEIAALPSKLDWLKTAKKGGD